MRNKARIIYSLVLIIVLSALLLSASFALYTNQAYKKGIVSIVPKEPLFSSFSDVLKQYPYLSEAEDRNDRTLTVLFSNSNIYSFSVQNTGAKSGSVNQMDIHYTLSFNIEQINPEIQGDYYPTVKVGEGNGVKMTGTSYTLPETQILLGRTRRSIEYSIEFPDAAIDNIILKVEARPVESGGYAEAAGGVLLYRELAPKNNGAGGSAAFLCEGHFDDFGADNTDPVEAFAAFNYSVTVDNGTGSFTLNWDNRYLSVNESFTDELGLTPQTEGSISTLTFDVDSDVADIYEIVFYRTALAEGLEPISSVEMLESLVTYSYSAAEEAS